MELQLDRLRKAAGYKSRKSFAEAFGINERQIKAWNVESANSSYLTPAI